MRKQMWKYFINGSYYFQQKVESFHLHLETRQNVAKMYIQFNTEKDVVASTI